MKRYLAIDLGDKRTGIAVGDTETGFVMPIEVLTTPRGEQLMIDLLRVIQEHCPDALVIGLPLNMDGTEGPRAQISREFGRDLQRRSALPVHFQDERLTSADAEELLNQSGRTHAQKKRLRDALAAAAILRDFLDAD